MNKGELIEAISQETQESKAVITRVMDSLMRQIQVAVAEGRGVRLAGFGKFELTKLAARTGRNPSTGEPIALPVMRRPRFTAGSGFKDAVRDD